MPEYYVAFWNVENLFDIEDSPRRSEKLQRTLAGELKGWTQDVLDAKIKQLASIITQFNDGKGPDLFGVCEIENEYVLDLLKKALNPLNRNYKIAHADTQDERGIDVAFIYDSNCLTAKEQFSHFIVKRTATRDILQVNFQTNSGKRLVIVGNHWPSRTAGQYESEPFRIIAGETLAYFHERIRQVSDDENVAVLAMGDFNDQPFDRSLVGYAQSEQSRTKVTKAQKAKFLNLMWPILGQGIGTYYYDSHAHIFDQFLASKGLLTGNSGIEVLTDSIKVLQVDEMKGDGAYPIPKFFGRPSGKKFDMNGFSDHYPICVRLKEA